MKNIRYYKRLLAGLGMLGLVACQQVPSVTSNGGYPDQTPTDNSIKLCADGTLNCYVTVTNTTTIQPVEEIKYTQTYEDCILSCNANADGANGSDMPLCSGITKVSDFETATSTQCIGAFAACDSQCSVKGTNTGPYIGLPQSDPIALPANPKVVLVDITGCYDEQAPYEVHFRGPEVSFTTPIEGIRGMRASIGGLFGAKSVKLGYGVGRADNSNCNDLRNVVDVKFTPIADTKITVGTQSVAVVPFTNKTMIDRKYAKPDSVSFGVPPQIRDEVDLSQVTWILKEIPESDPKMGPGSIFGFRYYDNDKPYGESIVFLDYTVRFLGATATKQKITMYLFIKSKE